VQIKDVISKIEFKNISETLRSLCAYHTELSSRGELNNACPVKIFLKTGRTSVGFILNYTPESRSLVLVNNANLTATSSGLSILDVSSIEGVELDQFEKVYQFFPSTDVLEGIGDPPTIFGLEKDAAKLKTIAEKNLFSDLDIVIDREEFKNDETTKSGWALNEAIKNLRSLVEYKEFDDEFESEFVSSVEKLHIVSAKEENISLENKTLLLSLNCSQGIQGVPSASEIFDFLYNNL